MELFANNADTTLNGGITNVATSLVVVSSALFPSTGNFTILIGSEILLVTAVAGTTWTVSRGQEGTTAVAHNNGERIDHVITNGSLQRFRADNTPIAAFASRPTVGVAGRIFLPNNSYYLQSDDGSVWRTYGPLFPLIIPDTTGFGWINQDTATFSQTNGSLVISNAGGVADELRLLTKTAPATPYVITTLFTGAIDPTADYGYGLSFRESGSGKLHNLNIGGNAVVRPIIVSEKWNSPTSFNAGYVAQEISYIPQFPNFLRIEDDGTNRKCSYSSDGVNFILFHLVGRTDFLTADEVGIFIRNSTNAIIVNVLSWKES